MITTSFPRAIFTASALAVAAMPAAVMGAPAAVDIQFSICAPSAQVEQALKLRQTGPSIQVWLFDDASLSLFSKGLRIRLREAKSGGELTLKVADQDCAKVANELLPAGEGKCELDMHDGKTAGALSLTRKIDIPTVQSLINGRRAIADELSEAQTRFLRRVPGAWPLPSVIRTLGPARVTSYHATDKPFTVDVSALPSGETYIEISQKVTPVDALRTSDALVADIKKSGIPLCADQSAQAVNKLRKLLAQP